MKTIAEIDKNFALKEYAVPENSAVYNVLEEPFSLHGLIPPQCSDDVFRRMPKDRAEAVSEAVTALHTHCAGGRVRFRTDSPYIAIVATLGEVGKMPHFALTGSAGFDLYSGLEHIASFQPRFDITDSLFGAAERCGNQLREYTLNFPLYSEVRDVRIILNKDAALLAAEPYAIQKPVVFYGSSITQGGCASRPGNCYSAILSRRMNFEHINLGFSGSAQGEPAMAEHIAGMEMSAFIYDYDYNAPTDEHYEKTYGPFFQRIRSAHPELPVICLNRPFPEAVARRNDIIKTTVDRAREQGDKHVYFLDVNQWLKDRGIENEGSVDRCHPNDLGFYYMAQAVQELLKTVL